MSTASETVLQAVRDWLKASGASGGLANEQVIVAEPDAARPPKPYLTVQVTTPGVVVGSDEILNDLNAGSPRRRVNGFRRATVSIQGFGAGAEAWLERAVLALPLSSVVDAFTAAGVGGPVVQGGIRDLSQLVGTAWEPRWGLDVEIPYTARTADADAESPVALDTVESDWTLTDPAGGPDLTFTQTIST